MRRLTALALLPVLIWFGVARPAAAEAPLCTLSTDFARELMLVDAVLGAAAYDLRTGTIWSGGHSGPFALHSVIKPPIAWAVLSDAYDNGRELTEAQQHALFYMVAWSQNPDVTTLLSMIGGLSGLTEFYKRWGVPELVDLTHRSRWGMSRAEPVHLARLFGALAVSDSVPEQARADGFDLLRSGVENHRWGATIPEPELPGWESLIKTGNFTLPETEDDDPVGKIDQRNYRDDEELLQDLEQAEAEAVAAGQEDTRLKSLPSEQRPTVRMNSAAIWLGPPWRGSQPRYVIAIMQESSLSWSGSRALQNRIGEILAHAIAQREAGEWSQPPSHCIKRALS